MELQPVQVSRRDEHNFQAWPTETSHMHSFFASSVPMNRIASESEAFEEDTGPVSLCLDTAPLHPTPPDLALPWIFMEMGNKSW